jgi:hypothetical protein
MTKDLLPSRSCKALLFTLLRGRPRPTSIARRDPRTGQAYTEYLVILGFGVLLAFGMALSGANEESIVNRLYGYIFDYYASLANYMNLPFF